MSQQLFEPEQTSNSDAEPNAARPLSTRRRNLALVGIVGVVAIIGMLVLLVWSRNSKLESQQEAAKSSESKGLGSEVELSPEAISAAGLEIVGVTQRPAVSLMKVTGTIEANEQQTQNITPLVAGKIERVFVKLGDRVRAGTPLATVSSPQIAELHAKLHEAQTHLQIAERNYQRVQRSENRVAVLQAKAKLDEAQATLTRTKRLIELGAGAGKDLIAAETAYNSAKAEFDFQSNILLSKEVQEARAEVETTRADIAHIKDQMRAYGASNAEIETEERNQNTALIMLRAPSAGTISERAVNPGSGFEAGKPLFTIANLSGVWVIANVPEGSVKNLHVGTPAEVRSSALGNETLAGHVSYISPQLDETTRTAHVRIDVPNPGEVLRVGMFAEVGFQTSVAGTGEAAGDELVIPSDAVQSVGDRTIVFMPKDTEPGHFLVRDVQLGPEADGYRKVLSGLALNDRVVTKGSFTLKTRLLRSELEEE